MDVEIYTLRIFVKVMKLRSFSETARQMGLTQPTVSQQIGKLEGNLGKRLFERVGHDIIPTPLAKQLLPYASQLTSYAEECEAFLLEDKTSMKGEVSYAMPESCQWTPHFRSMMKQISAFPDLKFKIGILPTDKVAQGIIEGEYDFGFIVGEKLYPELTFEKFSDEPYGLVAKSEKLFAGFKSKDYESLRIVTYPGWDLFFTTWAKTNGLYEQLKKRMSLPTVHIGTLAGAIHAVQEGGGIGVLPLQCVPKGLVEHRIKDVVASNPIYITKRVGDKLSSRAQAALDMLKKTKNEIE
jgi:DNA-binding transcriptional LysR family regulator